MNERLVFPFSVVFAELVTSALFYVLLPETPLTRRFPALFDYLGGHALASLGVWAALVVLSLMLAPKLWRRRQNRSSKISLLVRLGVLGLAIDACGSISLWSRLSDEGQIESGSPLAGVLTRLGIYAVLFAVAVLVSDWIAARHQKRNPPTVTPPPQFGRP